MIVSAIVIKSADDIIAVDGKLPWNLKEDMQIFKFKTKHDAVVMGRKTWETLYVKPLPDRYNLVMSRSKIKLPGAEVVQDISVAIRAAYCEGYHNLWVIGGLEIYKAFQRRIDEWHVTRVNEIIGHGLKIDKLDKTIWECSEVIPATTFNGVFKTYTRRPGHG